MKIVNSTNMYKFNDRGSGANPGNIQLHNDLREEKPMSTWRKACIVGASVATIGVALASIAKLQKCKIHKIKIEEPQMIGIAAASVLGGLWGGVLFDKTKYAKGKAREAFTQLFGNTLVTLGFVSATGRIARYFKASKPVEAAATAVGLVSGVFCGNRMSNLINTKLFKQKVDRGIKVSDAAPHVDDIAFALNSVCGKTLPGTIMSRLIPFALIVPGSQTGLCRKID